MVHQNGRGHKSQNAQKKEQPPRKTVSTKMLTHITALLMALAPLVLAIVELIKTGHAIGWW